MTGDDDARSETATGDGTAVADMDQAELYTVVRAAVADALFEVVGTVLLVGLSLVLLAVGARVVFRAESVPGVVFGLVIGAIGVYVAAATLEVVPPIREWF